jgi:hypothetical protein
MIRILLPALLAWPVLAPQATQVVVLEAQADATLIEHPAGLLANGKGPHLSVGRTNQPAAARRRGALRFDVAGALPRDARIEDATRVLQASRRARRAMLNGHGAFWWGAACAVSPSPSLPRRSTLRLATGLCSTAS